MARRKAANASDTEVVEKTADAGDASPPKRKKTQAKTVNKNEEERQIRLPRAAKLPKPEQTDSGDTAVVSSAKNTKTKAKPLPQKNAATATKTTSKARAGAKAVKEKDETSGASPGDAEDAQNAEETQAKKTRGKTATKKAGMNDNDDAKSKPKGRSAKNSAAGETENSDAPPMKRKRNVKLGTMPKETKPKAKTSKGKAGNSKNKLPLSTEDENDTGNTENAPAVQKTNKKASNDKPAKAIAPARKTRGKKNDAPSENIQEDDAEAVEEPSEVPQANTDDDTEADEPKAVQQTKKGKNTRKKDDASMKKAPAKTRGKVVMPDEEDETEMAKPMKESQKKLNKESAPATAPPKKGRGKNVTAPVKEDITEKEDTENDSAGEMRLQNSTQTLLSNNNVEKSSEEDEEEPESESDDLVSGKIPVAREKDDDTSLTQNSDLNAVIKEEAI